jgi:hypothetical protein
MASWWWNVIDRTEGGGYKNVSFRFMGLSNGVLGRNGSEDIIWLKSPGAVVSEEIYMAQEYGCCGV